MSTLLSRAVKSVSSSRTPSSSGRDFLLKPPSKEPVWVEVPITQYAMLDGRGDPNAAAFKACVGALYALSYAVKFSLKRNGLEHKVQPLEGLWWFEGGGEFNPEKDRTLWRWTAMIAQPDELTVERFAAVLEEVKRKKKLPELERVRFESLHEGKAAQIMHIGPYSEEPATLARLYAFIHESGFGTNPLEHKHHEIYLSDPTRTAPARMRTILREPVR